MWYRSASHQEWPAPKDQMTTTSVVMGFTSIVAQVCGSTFQSLVLLGKGFPSIGRSLLISFPAVDSTDYLVDEKSCLPMLLFIFSFISCALSR